MSEDVKITLLPCPRCGKNGQICSVVTALGYYSRCWDCGLQLSEHCETAPRAAAEWNAFAGKFDALKRERDELGDKLYRREQELLEISFVHAKEFPGVELIIQQRDVALEDAMMYEEWIKELRAALQFLEDNHASINFSSIVEKENRLKRQWKELMERAVDGASTKSEDV